jgi:GTP pyrophosphokinase
MDYASSLLSFLPGGRRAPGISQLLTKLEAYLPPEQVERVQEAYELASAAHKGQKRLTGEAYITHPVAVASILADLHLDGQTICAALLHDVIEDTPTAKEEILERFGREVAELVDGVSKLDKVQFKSRKEAQAESFRKMILAMVRDIRVIMVKLADRSHNMRTLGAMPVPKRRRIALETPEIYAPIAKRPGVTDWLALAQCRVRIFFLMIRRPPRSTHRSPTGSASIRSSSSSRTSASRRCIRSATRCSSAS